MSLRQSGMVEVTSGTDAIALQMESNESCMVREIYYYVDGAQAEDIKVSVDRKVVLQFKAPSGWYLLANNYNGGYKSLMQYMAERGMFPQVPVGSGQKLTVTAPGASNYMAVVYDLYDADDIRPDMRNGSQASEYDLFQVISNSAAATAAGDIDLDDSDLDSIFPDFPGGDVVPGRYTMSLLSLFGTGYARGDGSDNTFQSTRLRMLGDRVDIFDKDLEGLLLRGDSSYTTDGADYDTIVGRMVMGLQYQDPKIVTFDNPIVFREGSELNVKMTVLENTDGDTLPANDLKVGMHFNVYRNT